MSIVRRWKEAIFKDRKRFMIIGSGPAGMYTAKYLLQYFKTPKITILEANSHPFGLLSHGVSPDNLPIKTIEQQFSAIAKKVRIKLNKYSPINYNTLNKVSSKHDAVFIATGCERPVKTRNVLAAIDFINYINGYKKLDPTLLSRIINSKTINILGLGNVSLDVARLITLDQKYIKDNKYLKDEIKDFLSKVNPNRINIVGRKSLFETKFGIPELKELKNKSTYKLKVDSSSATYDSINNKHRRLNKVSTFLSDLPTCQSKDEYDKVINFQFNSGMDILENDKTINIESFGFKQKDDIKIGKSADNKYLITDDSYKIPPFNNVYAIGWAKTGARGTLSDTVLSAKSLVGNLYKEKLGS